MEINREIIKELDNCKIYKDDGLAYLLSVYYNIKPTYIPENIIKRVNATKIFDNTDKLKWKLDLFIYKIADFDWVKNEYCALFSEINKLRGGYIKESILRLKNIMHIYPGITKEEIIGATKMYIASVSQPEFLMQSNYFIEKGMGQHKTNTILTWIDHYREKMRNDTIGDEEIDIIHKFQ